MDEVKFEAKIGKWLCIKKGKMDADDSLEAARVLASIHDSMDRKIWEYLGNDINLEELNQIAYEITGAQLDKKKKNYIVKGRVSEAQLATSLAKCNSPSTTKKMNLPDNKHAKELAKSYLTRKVLDLLNVRLELDPSIVEKFQKEKINKGL